MLHVTIWMNVPSFYQEELFESITAINEIDLRIVYAHELPSARRGLGWQTSSANTTNFRRTLSASRLRAVIQAACLAWTERGRMHIVNGIWAEPSFAAGLAVLSVVGSRFAIYAEAPTPQIERSRGKQLLRSVFGRWVATRPNANLLPIAKFAEQAFQRLGFRPEATYPFAYFRLKAKNHSARIASLKNHINVIYVGQFIHRKGVDVLLAAMGPLCAQEPRLHLTLIGDGAMRAELAAQAAELGISDRVTFAGVVPSDDIRQRIAESDILVLPSRWDGWGLVVNEAFSVGVPVLVSDRCGVADIVDHERNGFVFRGEDEADLRANLRTFIQQWPNRAMADEARQTGEFVSAERAAAYLVECLRHIDGQIQQKPLPPWVVVAHTVVAT